MPKNRLKIEWETDKPLKVRVWDKDGVVHDVTDVFEQITGTTAPARINTEVWVRHPVTGAQATFRFVPSEKELEFGVLPSLVEQLLAFQAG